MKRTSVASPFGRTTGGDAAAKARKFVGCTTVYLLPMKLVFCFVVTMRPCEVAQNRLCTSVIGVRAIDIQCRPRVRNDR
jgi:hypothetical protein